MYCLNVKHRVKPERRAEYLSALQNLQRDTLNKEELAVAYTIGEDTETPNTFYLHEQYKGTEGFEAHKASAHFATWKMFIGSEPFEGNQEVWHYMELGDSNPKGKGKGKGGKGGNGKGYCLNVKWQVNPDRREEFLKVIAEDQKGTLTTEKLASIFLYGEATREANQFHGFERYMSKYGFDAHLKTPHYEAYKTAVDGGILTEEAQVAFYNEIAPLPALKKPTFSKVKSIDPDGKGLNLMLKCTKCTEVEGGASKSWEVVLGDDTGVVTFSLRDASQAAVCKVDSAIRVQNAKVIMVQGHIRVIVDKWGVLKASEEPLDFEVNSKKDVSAVEYELKDN